MFPNVMIHSRAKTLGAIFLEEPWLKLLASHVELRVIESVTYLSDAIQDKWASAHQYKIELATTKIPVQYRIGDSMFTTVHISGGMHEGIGFSSEPRVDSIFTAYVICNSTTTNNPLRMEYKEDSISFANNVIIFGEFHLIPILVKAWQGDLILIRFELSTKIFEHFIQFDETYTSAFENEGQPSGNFLLNRNGGG